MDVRIADRLAGFGTTIFTEMSALAVRTNAVNLGQGFPDSDGPQVVIDTLVNHARSLIYTTAPPPAQAAALTAALDLVAAEPQRRERLRDLSLALRAALADRGWPGVAADQHVTPIVALRVGTADAALTLAQRLENADVLAVAIRPPTVPPGTARVRLSLRCDLTDDDLSRVVDAIGPA